MTLDRAIGQYTAYIDAEKMGITSFTITTREAEQLAEWLKELEAYRDARVGCEYCKHNYREQHERPCSLCQRNFMDMFEFEKEVNADEYNNKNPVINGIRHNIPEWCDIYNIKRTTVYDRIKKGMDVVEAITTPLRR